MAKKEELEIFDAPRSFDEIDLEVEGFESLSIRDRQLALVIATKSYHKKSIAQIAREFEITRARVYAIMRKKEFTKFVKHVQEQLFEELFEKTIFTLHDILDNSKSDNIRIKTAGLILQASGRMKTENIVEVDRKQPKSLDALEQEVKELETELLDD